MTVAFKPSTSGPTRRRHDQDDVLTLERFGIFCQTSKKLVYIKTNDVAILTKQPYKTSSYSNYLKNRKIKKQLEQHQGADILKTLQSDFKMFH